jgi:photosystem II stability/assembly factor-like uncharacterized protein
MANQSSSDPLVFAELSPGAICLALSVSRSASRSEVAAATTAGLAWLGDDGLSWKLQVNTPAFESVVLSPRFEEDSTIHAIEHGELFGSLDGGRTWTALLGGSSVFAIATTASGDDDLVVLAGTETDGVFRSDDGGRSWQSVTSGLLDLTVQAVAASPSFARDKTVFLGTPSGLYRSRNGGFAWRRMELPSEDPIVQAIAISPGFQADGAILVGTETDGLFLGRDGGRDWESVKAFSHQSITAAACDYGGRLAAASQAGVGLSNDGGATWRMSGAHLGPLLALAFVPGEVADEPLLIAGPATGGLFATDDGATWRSVT